MSLQQLVQQSDPRNLAIGALIATTLLATYSFKHHSDDRNLPPLVPYKYPFIGSTIDYYRDPDGFVRDVVAKYGPTFRVYLLGRVQTIVSSKEHIKKVLTSDKELDFIAARQDIFNAEPALGIPSKDILHVGKVVSDYLTPHLKEYTPRVVKQLETGLQIYLGDFEGQKIIDDPTEMIGYIISRASASIFVGEELCENPELIESFRTFTIDIGTQMAKLGPIQLFPRLSHLWQSIYFNYLTPKSKHTDIIKRIVLPIVEKRRREKAELGDKWQRPDDVLQHLVEGEDPDPSKPIDRYRIIGNLFGLIFASIHTTTANTTAVLYRLANNPQYIPELRQELDSIFEDPESEDYLTSAMVKKLIMLDSFVRETLRLSQEPITLQHKNVTGKALDIGDGVIIPAGEHVGINEMSSRLSDDQGDLPENFDPWRFVGKGKNASRIGTDHLAFGMGKHACPGRFLAIQEIKTAISILITHYDFQTVGENSKGPIEFTKIR